VLCLTLLLLDLALLLLLSLQSFLIEISAIIAAKKDEDGSSLVDKIVDKTGAKGTGAQ
jgi:6-phosphogluconate dehydrogenase